MQQNLCQLKYVTENLERRYLVSSTDFLMETQKSVTKVSVL